MVLRTEEMSSHRKKCCHHSHSPCPPCLRAQNNQLICYVHLQFEYIGCSIGMYKVPVAPTVLVIAGPNGAGKTTKLNFGTG
jgi:hypothetical protein